ncbi:MAG: hypothetical protein ABIQ40_12700, partial [Bacteroidia bacterium]
SLYSVNYCRKVIIKKNCLLFSLGFGTLKENGYDPIGMRSTNIALFNSPAGILWRYNYKRNGLLVGVFFTAIFGAYILTSGLILFPLKEPFKSD